MMSKHLNRPVIGMHDDGSRYLYEAGPLIHRAELKVATYTDQVRAEMWEYLEGQPVGGHLVWEHHIRRSTDRHESGMTTAEAMRHTSEWLARRGWPGLTL